LRVSTRRGLDWGENAEVGALINLYKRKQEAVLLNQVEIYTIHRYFLEKNLHI
jgi:hypothetical protein